MNKKKIACYINTLEYGGAERVLSLLANKLSENNYEVILITSYSCKNEYILNNNVKRLNLDKNEIDSKFMRNYKRITTLRKYIKEYKIDYLISFMAEANFRAIIASLFLHTKCIISVRNDPHKEYQGISFILANILFILSNKCVFQTNDAKECFNYFIKRKSKIILNPISDKFFQNGYSNCSKDIITVGRLVPQKNHEFLIKAFKEVSLTNETDNLLIYGTGPLENQLKTLIKELELQDRVFLMGKTDHVNDILNNKKIFILSSDYEGLPNSLMEAIAMGLPVISTDCPCGGPRMLIQDNENGFLVDVENIESMKDKILLLLSSNELQNKFNKNNIIIRESFSENMIFEQWISYILRGK